MSVFELNSMATSWLTWLVFTLLVLRLSIGFCATFNYVGLYKQSPNLRKEKSHKINDISLSHALSNIDSVEETFDWRLTQPFKSRPFKDTFHLTMNLMRISPSDIIQVDKLYLDHIKFRRNLLRTQFSDVIGPGGPNAKSAIDEIYSWLLGVYLPRRFPGMFDLVHLTHESSQLSSSAIKLRALVTGDEFPIVPPKDQADALRIIAGLVEEEFLILIPSDDEDGYILGATIFLFDSGVNHVQQVGMKLRDVHTPVPGYKEKLEKSMYRVFDRLPTGRVMRRETWSIFTHPAFRNPNGDIVPFDPQKCHLHVDLQCLYRLPASNALVLSFHEYKTPMTELKREDDGKTAAALLKAIEGLENATIMGLPQYKGLDVWGDDVRKFLQCS